MLNEEQRTGVFVPTTQVWDVSKIYDLDVTSEEFKELIVRLYQQLNSIAIALNSKETGVYIKDVFNNGSRWFNPNTTDPEDLRPGYQTVVEFGAVNTGGSTTQPHNISIPAGSTIKFTAIYGCVNDSTGRNYLPIGYATTLGSFGTGNITVDVNATNVVIWNNSGTNFTSATVVLKFLEF